MVSASRRNLAAADPPRPDHERVKRLGLPVRPVIPQPSASAEDEIDGHLTRNLIGM